MDWMIMCNLKAFARRSPLETPDSAGHFNIFELIVLVLGNATVLVHSRRFYHFPATAGGCFQRLRILASTKRQTDKVSA